MQKKKSNLLHFFALSFLFPLILLLAGYSVRILRTHIRGSLLGTQRHLQQWHAASRLSGETYHRRRRISLDGHDVKRKRF